jgi:outer membrane biosynthesis protein TonB
MRAEQNKLVSQLLLFFLIFVQGFGDRTARAAPPETPLPAVLSAAVPFYPRICQVAHIEGTVHLRITTDGKTASAIHVEDGPPMLARAAVENVKTWKFENHSPTTFRTIFSYSLFLSECDAGCRCRGTEKPAIILHLPGEVDIRAEEVLTCDPAVKRPL